MPIRFGGTVLERAWPRRLQERRAVEECFCALGQERRGRDRGFERVWELDQGRGGWKRQVACHFL